MENLFVHTINQSGNVHYTQKSNVTKYIHPKDYTTFHFAMQQSSSPKYSPRTQQTWIMWFAHVPPEGTFSSLSREKNTMYFIILTCFLYQTWHLLVINHVIYLNTPFPPNLAGITSFNFFYLVLQAVLISRLLFHTIHYSDTGFAQGTWWYQVICRPRILMHCCMLNTR